MKHVLSRSREVSIDLERYRADELKQAARFWIGKEATSYRRAVSLAALTRVFARKTALGQVVAKLSEKQRSVLRIFARYGPTVSGSLLAAELEARGLVKNPDAARAPYYASTRDDLVLDLRSKLVLIGGSYDSYYYGAYGRRHSDLTLHPAIAAAVTPARPLPWKPSRPAANVVPAQARSPAEPAMDLWRVAEALREMGNWKTVKGDAPAKSVRNKLRKLVALPSAEDDRLHPPDPESLCYELLHEMGFLEVEWEPRAVRSDLLAVHFDAPSATQAWQWLRAWMDMRLWQDGIGVVPDRDNPYEPVRIEPDCLRNIKELLVWALCRVARSPVDWLDLEGFLKDFREVAHHHGRGIYWHEFTWVPGFALVRSKEQLPAGPERSLAYWLDREGTWTANAIMVTLVTLGLVQRGESVDTKKRPCFRLTEIGRQVFGAPETEIAAHREAAPFLTVQPNHDILAYLDAADASEVRTLARFARHAKTNGGRVQVFTLSRESVYAALEGGMSAAEIQDFLAQHGKTELPANVVRALTEWSGRRESLVLRHGATLALAAEAGALERLGTPAQAFDETAARLKNFGAKTAAQKFPGWSVCDHQAALPQVWRVDELGNLHSRGSDTVSSMRLKYLAEHSASGWRISGKSIARARSRGFVTDQMLGWLAAHLEHPIPALLQMAIRNWCGRTKAFVGKVRLLQITRTDARDAVLGSDVFEPLLAGHIPPCWFIVRDDKFAETKRLLERLGFQSEATYQVATLDESRSLVTEFDPPVKRTRGGKTRRGRC